MKPKKAILLILSLFLVLSATGQKQKSTCVNLKNGSIIYGRILENYPDSLIKIQTEGNNIWVFKYSEIDTVIQSSPVSNKSARPYNILLQTGFNGLGSNSNFNPAFSLLFSATYTVKERYSFGLTTGAEYFGIPIMPLAIEAKADFFKSALTPYVYLRGGYAFKLIPNQTDYDWYKTTYKGGILYDAGIGVKKRFSPEFALILSVGYAHRETYEYRDYIYEDSWNSDYERHYFYNRTEFLIGFVF
jgi:hypothetical protein